MSTNDERIQTGRGGLARAIQHNWCAEVAAVDLELDGACGRPGAGAGKRNSRLERDRLAANRRIRGAGHARSGVGLLDLLRER